MNIETNIPLPTTNYRQQTIELINSTSKGQSVLFSKPEGEKMRLAISNYLYRNPHVKARFITRYDRSTGGIRIWRSE